MEMPRVFERLIPLLALAAGLAAAPAGAQQDVTIQKSTNGQDADAPPGPVLAVGTPVTWTYLIANAGTSDEASLLSNIVVTDDQGVTVSCPQTTLAAGESMTCTASGTAQAGQYTNLGTVVAQRLDQTQVSASDASHYFGQGAAAVDLEKSTNGSDADAPPGPLLAVGTPVSWQYVVTNVGSGTLSNVAVTDDQGVVVSCPQTTLAAGASMTCTAGGTAQAGQYRNVGTVVAEPAGGPTTADSDASHYFGLLFEASKTATLVIDQNGNGLANPGDTLAYTIVLVNHGAVELSDVAFADTPDVNSGLVVGSVTTTAGTVASGNAAGDTAVAVTVGTLSGNGGTATLGFRVTVADPLPGGVTQVSNQGLVTAEGFDGALTDDPAVGGIADPTVVAVSQAQLVEVPGLAGWGFTIFAILLAALGVRRIGQSL